MGVRIADRARDIHPERTAVVHPHTGESFRYDRLLADSEALAQHLLATCGTDDLGGRRVGFMSPPSYDYVVMQWAAWRAGGIAVPMSTHAAGAELSYAVKDADCEVLLSHPRYADAMGQVAAAYGRRHFTLEPSAGHLPKTETGTPPLPETIGDDRPALMIYTSGTTGKPKGVLTTHGGLNQQVDALVQAWEWTAQDRISNVLPLHHVHGVVNVLTCALHSGATCEMPPRLDATALWERIAGSKEQPDQALSLVMGVPTVYSRLIAAWEEQPQETRRSWTEACAGVRLMVCGSAALPEPTMKRWKEVSGHTLLERYGMTEIGMGLSNPLHGVRRPGYVGLPLPGVTAKIAVADGEEGAACFVDARSMLPGSVGGGEPLPSTVPVEGELRIKGKTVFSEYWRNPEATAKEFDEEGFFRTGDICRYDPTADSYAILGRASVDIIKSGGYKLSALEIERELLAHPGIDQCAVVGIPDVEWGERVTAVVVPTPQGADLTVEALREWSGDRLARYKQPSVLHVVPEIERNAMGKINKKQLVKQLVASAAQSS